MALEKLKEVFKKRKEKKEKERVEEEKKIAAMDNARYPGEECALCQQPGCEMKWMGQYWHKKCLRNARKMAKGMM